MLIATKICFKNWYDIHEVSEYGWIRMFLCH